MKPLIGQFLQYPSVATNPSLIFHELVRIKTCMDVVIGFVVVVVLGGGLWWFAWCFLFFEGEGRVSCFVLFGGITEATKIRKH